MKFWRLSWPPKAKSHEIRLSIGNYVGPRFYAWHFNWRWFAIGVLGIEVFFNLKK